MSSSRYLKVVVVLITFGCTSGCDDNTIITPFSERDVHYSIYGFISTTDTQLVRIVPVRKHLERDVVPIDLRAVVSSTELNSGRLDMWSPVLPQLNNGDRGVQFDDSTFGHVYRAIFTPNTGDKYEFRVEGFDGKKTTAQATIPSVPRGVAGSYFEVEGEVHQHVQWPGLSRQPFSVATWYYFMSTDLRPQEFAVPLYHNSFGEISGEGLIIDMNLNEDIRLLRKHIVDNLSLYSSSPTVEDPDTFNLVMTDRRIRIFVGDSTWNFISAVPDRARISQPGAFSNVEDGFGYFGGLGTSIVEANITDPVIRQQMGLSL